MSEEEKEFEERVRRELVPIIQDASIVLSITPTSDNVDIKFAVELGLAIMMDKPIIAVIRPGTPIPEKLSRVVDRFVELDLEDPTIKERLMDAVQEVLGDTE